VINFILLPFNPGKNLQYPLNMSVLPKTGIGVLKWEKFLAMLGFEFQNIRPVAYSVY
jgi:hypothetical protein